MNNTMNNTITAAVNPRLFTKASRLFTGTLAGRVIEVLQNARRAGARNVQITTSDGIVTVRDDGRGIEARCPAEPGSRRWSRA
jgi:hypothetical protein